MPLSALSDVLGVVLAGGRSTRMGKPKAGLELAGRALIERPLEAMRSAGLDTVVVAKVSGDLPALEVPVWSEPDEPVHPLTGIVAALERGRRPVVVCGCDLPFVPPALLAELASRSEPLVVAEGGRRLHPLLGRYDPALLESLRAARDAQRAMHDVVAELHGKTVEAPEQALFNVNTPADLARAEELARSS